MSVRILIECEGGLVQNVFCDEDHSVMVIDYDVSETHEEEETYDMEGNLCYADYWGRSLPNHRRSKNWELLEREEEP